MISAKLKCTCFVLIFLCGTAVYCGPSSAAAGRGTEILWDSWGVPHIFSHDDPNAFRAFGWAQMHNHGDLLLRLYALGRGRGAEYFGRENLALDRMVHTMGTYALASQGYANQSRSFRANLDAFAEGINTYAKDHGEELDPAARQVLPVDGRDVLAHVMRVLWLFQGGVSGCTAAVSSAPALGSNGWAISPAHSADHRAMLLANPHLPWSQEMLFFEAQIVTPNYEAYGATLVGFPVLAIAFNQALGWTHTVNVIDPCDLYLLTSDGDGYLLDGRHHAFVTSTETVGVHTANGIVAEELRIRRSVQGPVIERQGKLFAVRDAGLQQGSFAGVLEQWWTMGRARSLSEFQAALHRMQLPMFNTVYADRDGNILLFYAGLVPKRNEGDFTFWSAPVPGDRSATLWTTTLGYANLPKVINPEAGWVQNSNSAPWYMTIPLIQPANFPGYLAPPFTQPQGWPNFREQRGLRMLTEVPRLSFEQLIADKYSTRSELADRLLDDLLAAAENSSNDLTNRATAVLKSWDRSMDASSRGAVLFAAWARRMVSQGSAMAVPFDPARLLDTPRGLKDKPAALQQLEAAAREVESRYGKLDVPWGELFRLRLGSYDFPANGGPGSLGVFRVIEFAPDKDGRFRSIGGDSFIAAVEFSQPIKASVLLTYGNSSRPGSRHFGDQLELSAKKQLRTAWMTRHDIEEHLEERFTLPEIPGKHASQRPAGR